jgi:hypothetical protein
MTFHFPVLVCRKPAAAKAAARQPLGMHMAFIPNYIVYVCILESKLV